MIRALALLTVAALVPQQAPSRDTAPQTGTASIAGVVIAAADKQPIGYARVVLNNSARITYTNAKGEFLFPNLPAGRYAISAQANGYLAVSLGQSQSGRPGIAQVLAAGEDRKGVVLALHKGGIVSGHVVGPDGRPLAGAAVWPLRKTWAQDGRAIFSTSIQGVRTDDRGDYRIPGLVAGSYLVYVVPPQITGREDPTVIDEPQRLANEGMILTFYPGTTDSSGAVPLKVDVDTERAGIDFSIRPVPMWIVNGRVDGAVTDPSPRAAAGSAAQINAGNVRLVPAADAADGALALDFTRAFARVAPDGRFRFEAVPAGQYQLLYARGSNGTNSAYGMSTVSVVDRDVGDALVAAETAANITGEVLRPSGAGSSTAVPAFGLIPLAGPWRNYSSFVTARADASGTFTLNGVSPGRYAFRFAAPAEGIYLKNIDIDGAPASGTLVDVGTADIRNVRATFGTDVAEISGNVRHEDLSPVTEYALVIFPADKREWPVWMSGAGVTRADSAGHYKYAVKPGAYLIAAVEDVDQFQWLDPAFLESLIPTATKITLGPSQKLTQDFVVK